MKEARFFMRHLLRVLFCSFTAFVCLNGVAGEGRHFPADITKGNIRCVLMSVGQTTVFPNEKDQARTPPWRDGAAGVRCFTVTFLVEGLGDAPNEPRALRKLEVTAAGKPVHFGDGSEY